MCASGVSSASRPTDASHTRNFTNTRSAESDQNESVREVLFFTRRQLISGRKLLRCRFGMRPPGTLVGDPPPEVRQLRREVKHACRVVRARCSDAHDDLAEPGSTDLARFRHAIEEAYG